MIQRDRSIVLLAVVAPAILIMVAVSQWYRVSEQHLTPWKGGGFGMFSTVESRGARFVRCYLARRQGDEILQLRVPVPREWADSTRELSYMPTETGARALAHKLASATWVESASRAATRTDSQTDGQTDGAADPQADTDPKADDLPVLPVSPWVRGLPSTKSYGDGVPIDYSAVIVEVWTSSFDSAAGRMNARKVVEVTMPRYPRGPRG